MMPKGAAKFLLPMLMLAAMEGNTPTPDRIEAKEPVKSHGGAGRNIHKDKNKKRKNRQ